MNDCAEYIDRVIAEFQEEKKSDLTAEDLEMRTAKEAAHEFGKQFKERLKAQRANPEPDVPTVRDEASFEDLCEIEPCLKELESRIRAVDSFPSADAAAKAWQWRYKPAMMALVGYYARKPEMRSNAGYGTAYRYLYGLIEAKVWRRG